MLHALSEKVKRMSSARPLLLLTLLFIVMYMLINGQPFGIAEFNERFDGLAPLDQREGYTYQDVCAFMEKIGDTGRMFYAKMLLLLDFAFPLAYTLFWAAAIAFFWGRLLPCNSKLMYISLIPFAAGLADYLENLLLLSMLFSYPKILNLVVLLANFMTNAKDLFMWASLLLLLVGLMLYLIKLAGKTIKR